MLKIYLKWVNPGIALTVLTICTWIWLASYFVGEGSESPFEKGKNIFLYNQIAFYFFAKGLFCSSMLFLFGEFMKRYIENKS